MTHADTLVLVYALVWPPRKNFDADWDHATRRNPVKYYVNGLIDSICYLKRKFKVSHVVLHAHPHINSLVEALACVDRVVWCRKTDHWRYPLIARSMSA